MKTWQITLLVVLGLVNGLILFRWWQERRPTSPPLVASPPVASPSVSRPLPPEQPKPVEATKAPSTNACCPICFTSFRIEGTDNWTQFQQMAVNRPCPFCGQQINVFEAKMLGHPSQKQEVQRIQSGGPPPLPEMPASMDRKRPREKKGPSTSLR